MAAPYLCPACRANRHEFDIIYKLAQVVQKDEQSGDIVFQGDELTTLVTLDGRPDLDIRCGRCRYTGSETSFIRAAQRDDSHYVQRRRSTTSRA